MIRFNCSIVMLPPLRIKPTFLPASSSRRCIAAATAAAPAALGDLAGRLDEQADRRGDARRR